MSCYLTRLNVEFADLIATCNKNVLMQIIGITLSVICPSLCISIRHALLLLVTHAYCRTLVYHTIEVPISVFMIGKFSQQNMIVRKHGNYYSAKIFMFLALLVKDQSRFCDTHQSVVRPSVFLSVSNVVTTSPVTNIIKTQLWSYI